MKNSIKYISLIFLGFVFTGCVNTNINYNNNFVEKKTKFNLNKVNSVSVGLKTDDINRIIKKHPNSFTGKATSITLNTGSFNNKIANNFFNQYFTNVSNAKNSDIYVESTFKDYEYAYNEITEGAKQDIEVDIKVFYKGKLILDKKYKHHSEVTSIISLELDMIAFVKELCHKSLVELYEDKFKPDLLTALRNNI